MKKLPAKESGIWAILNPSFNFTDQSLIEVDIHEQSPEIAKGVKVKGAGDQGMMFGFACRETKSLMPLPIMIAHRSSPKNGYSQKKKFFPFYAPTEKLKLQSNIKMAFLTKYCKSLLLFHMMKKRHSRKLKKAVYKEVVKKVLEEFGFKISGKRLNC